MRTVAREEVTRLQEELQAMHHEQHTMNELLSEMELKVRSSANQESLTEHYIAMCIGASQRHRDRAMMRQCYAEWQGWAGRCVASETKVSLSLRRRATALQGRVFMAWLRSCN